MFRIGVIVKYMMLMLIVCVSLLGKRLHYESYYQNKWCDEINGTTEVVLPDNTRADCVTDKLAVEVDFADKWSECI